MMLKKQSFDAWGIYDPEGKLVAQAVSRRQAYLAKQDGQRVARIRVTVTPK